MASAHCPAELDADAIVLFVFIVFFLSLAPRREAKESDCSVVKDFAAGMLVGPKFGCIFASTNTIDTV